MVTTLVAGLFLTVQFPVSADDAKPAVDVTKTKLASADTVADPAPINWDLTVIGWVNGEPVFASELMRESPEIVAKLTREVKSGESTQKGADGVRSLWITSHAYRHCRTTMFVKLFEASITPEQRAKFEEMVEQRTNEHVDRLKVDMNVATREDLIRKLNEAGESLVPFENALWRHMASTGGAEELRRSMAHSVASSGGVANRSDELERSTTFRAGRSDGEAVVEIEQGDFKLISDGLTLRFARQIETTKDGFLKSP
jgi:hypothetical protein